MRQLNKYIISILILVALVCANNIQWGGNHWKDIVKADGKGYFAHLPAVFIYNDLNFSFFDSIEKKYPNPSIYYDYRIEHKGKIANKYFAGTALAMSPFFLGAHFLSSLFGFPTDGYSKLYLISISIAAIFYLWFGLYYLKKFLLMYSTNQTIISFILFVLVFSTNLFYYVINEPSMSHIYSFAFITAFVFYAKKYFHSPDYKVLLLLSILLGLIILIRPLNAIVLLLTPFLSGSWFLFKSRLSEFIKSPSNIFLFVSITFSIIVIQFIIYKIQTGYFFIDSYGDETFNWLMPHPIDFLFSYKKGLFVYTPILLLSLIGLFFMLKKDKFRFFSLILFLIILVYLLSAWWNWWYGGSFGTRVVLEYYSIAAFLLLFTFNQLKRRALKIGFYSVCIVFLLICQIQQFQYRYYHIHWEKMDKEHYWRCFLRVDLVKQNLNPNADLLAE
jgi:hypothetical protein